VLNHVGPVAAGASLPLDVRQRSWTEDPVLAAASRRLQSDANDLGLTAIALSETAGNCIAASNAGTDTSFVGVNYRDRNYYSDLLAGRSGYRITVGKQHGSSGIAFFAPIMVRGRVIGGWRVGSIWHVSALGVIQQGGEHLLALIDDILDLARIDADRLALLESEFLLDGFLRNAVETVAIKAREKGIAFSCDLGADLPVFIRADERRLRQVLFNLLANAVKFTHRGRVVLRVSRVGPSRVNFAVEDTGMGIADAELEAIFEPFEQAQGDVQKRFGGTGLGLSISRQLVRLMGGEILVQSCVGAGSVFHFELDVALAEMVSPQQDQQAFAPSQHSVLPGEPIDVLCIPPMEEMQVLHRLARRGNMRDILQSAERISGLDPCYEAFSSRLRQLAEGYQSKAILTFVEHYLHGKTA
jgi:anti-sigma regulatory factor (Ser/Thr protein kinase)